MSHPARQPRHRGTITALVAVVAVIACGETPTSPPSGMTPTNPAMSARVDGRSWNPRSVSASFQDGALTLFGVDRGDGPSTRMVEVSIQVSGVTGPGSHDLGPTNPAGTASVGYRLGFDVDRLDTELSPLAHSITISEIGPHHATGTFYFTAQGRATAGVATKVVVVTDGVFDVTF